MVKDEAKKLIDQLPEETTWDDIMYEIYARKQNRECFNGGR